MKKNLKYYLSLNYPYTVDEYEDNGEKYFSLEIPDLPGCGASGKTFDEALSRLNEAKELWLEESINANLPISEPVSEDDFSGKFLLRIPAKLHMELAKRARQKNISLNQYVRSLLEASNKEESERSHYEKISEFFMNISSVLVSQNKKIEQLNETVIFQSSRVEQMARTLCSAPGFLPMTQSTFASTATSGSDLSNSVWTNNFTAVKIAGLQSKGL